MRRIILALIVAVLSATAYALTGSSPTVNVPITIGPAQSGTGANAMLWGVEGLGYGVINRKADFSESGVDISNTNPFPACPTNNGSNYPIVAGVGGFVEPNFPNWNTAASGGYNSTYTTTINALANDCGANSVYLVRPDNEWWLGCAVGNPWYDATNNPSCDTTKPAVVTPTVFAQGDCQYIGVIRGILPNAKIGTYGPNQAYQQPYTDAVFSMCHPETVSFDLYFETGSNASGMAQWQQFCGSTTLTCVSPSGLYVLSTYAQGKGVPIAITEWCSSWNDTVGPHGGDWATWQFLAWGGQNNVVLFTVFGQNLAGAGCDPSRAPPNGFPNSGVELNAFFAPGGTATTYTASFWTYKTPP